MASSVTENNTQAQETRIHKNDVVNITMTSSNPESNLLFISNKNAASGTSLYKDGYRVNKSGYVNLPLIGDFKIEGLGVDEAQTKIAAELDKYVKNPVVDIQIVNFKITVIGEVNKPSTFIITDEKVNLLEALGMAGDMTVYGRRENVLVIRNEGNHKTMKRLNLNKQEAMNSPYFYLTQNDIVYVEPDRSKAVEYSQNTRLMPLVIASISAVAVLAAVLLKR
ncbi:polysaccharide biosynthesis/export family protein [Mucilaginibacter xinganensis]|nr:polysaccharide biosynthesis/export family protein [Mucilaginibacter xinganensis]